VIFAITINEPTPPDDATIIKRKESPAQLLISDRNLILI